MGARQEDLGAALLPPHVVNVRPDTVAVAEILARQALVPADDGLGPPEIDDDVAVLDALDDAVHDLAEAILVLVVLALAFGLADLLNDDLLGVLRRHAPEIQRRQLLGDEIAHLRRGIALARLLERDLGRLHDDVVHHLEQPLQPDFARVRVDLGADLVLAAIARLGRLLDRIFHGGDDDLAINGFLARYGVCNLQQFQPVCAYACLRHGNPPVPTPFRAASSRSRRNI